MYVTKISDKKYCHDQMFYFKICNHMKYMFAISIYLGFDF